MDLLRCPRCADPLQKTGTQRQADACPRGHGLFLARAEVARALDPQHARILAEAVGGSPVPTSCCPACEVDMREVRFADAAFLVDGCPRCGGFWFDEDELRKVRDGTLVPWRHGVPDVHPSALRTAQGVVLGGFALGGLWSLLGPR